MQKLETRLKNVLRLIGGNYVVLVVLLVSIELLGQLAFKLYTGKYIIEIFTPEEDWVFQSHPYLGITLKKDTYLQGEELSIRINDRGFRITNPDGYPVNEEAFNIVCIGGSTTFCTHVSDVQSWPFLLQQQLGPEFCVYNLGTPGYSTLEGIIQLSTVVSDLDPDLIIFYQGWNDLHSYHIRPRSPLYEWHSDMVKESMLVKPTSITKWYEGLFIFRFSRRIGRWFNKQFNILPQSPYKAEQVPDTYVDSLYSRNLKTMKALSDHLGAQSLFIPQVMNKDFLWETSEESTGWTPTIHNHSFPDLIDHLNQIMIKSFEDSPKIVLKTNGMQPYSWEKSDFEDLGHFSFQGNKRFANLVYTWIQDSLPQNPSN